MPSRSLNLGVGLRVSGAIALIAALGSAPSARAQVCPNGPEFQVNTYTTGWQSDPRVAIDPAGTFVVAWHSPGSSGTDTHDLSVQAQRYAANGAPLGAEFQVNTYTTSSQYGAAVAAGGDGRFVVAWTSDGSSDTDTHLHSVQARRYAANGNPLGDPFQVNTYTTSLQGLPAVASDGAGNFVVAWMSEGSSGTDNWDFSIQAQRYDANGVPLGSEFQVNSYTRYGQSNPVVACDPAGDFVVAWRSYGSSGTDTDGLSIQARRFAHDGTPLGDEFQVNTFTTAWQSDPGVASDTAGNFVVTWTSRGSSGTDTDHDSIQAQRYDSNGNPLGGQFQVNTFTAGGQDGPTVASDAAGSFVVAWGSSGSSGTDTSLSSIQAQRYDASANPLGGEFQVNTYTTSYQSLAAVASDATGDFVVAWVSNGSSGTDTSSRSIQAQRYDALFRDGFASGDTSRWSSTVP